MGEESQLNRNYEFILSPMKRYGWGSAVILVIGLASVGLFCGCNTEQASFTNRDH
jgi:hypothetical protein